MDKSNVNTLNKQEKILYKVGNKFFNDSFR